MSPEGPSREAAKLRVIRAYDSPIIRAYCWGRFGILHQRFLDEIGQYLPARGRVLDLGCGFGLFSLYYASVFPSLHLDGLDRNSRRIATACRAAERLGVRNVTYTHGDVMEYHSAGSYDAAYMLDIIHHIPPGGVRPLVTQLHALLPAGGRLLIKDVDVRPTYKRWFTHVLDKLMDPRSPVRYWSTEELQSLLEEVGFRVYRHLMVDALPYPHVLYINEKLS
jgi:2-polyprenyl-3-methyl-5-hydroxy-6-metoxy-1,4-benzoquinol methylase